MEHIAIFNPNGCEFSPILGALAERGLLDGINHRSNQSRVMAANHQSSLLRPADLDEFLQGYIHGSLK